MKFFVMTKFKIFCCFALIAVFVVSIWVVSVTETTGLYLGQSPRKLPIYSVETDEKVCSLTFDACWGAESTQGIVDCLNEFESCGTFFIVSIWAEKYNDELKMLSTCDYIQLGTHSATHGDMTKMSQDDIELELDSSVSMINSVTGVNVELFRPPYGAYNDTLITVAEEKSLQTIQWDVDSHDWMGISAEDIASRVLDNVQNGSIILMHNDGENTLSALPLILDGLKNKGYDCIKVGDMIYKEDYTIDHTGRQIRS